MKKKEKRNSIKSNPEHKNVIESIINDSFEIPKEKEIYSGKIFMNYNFLKKKEYYSSNTLTTVSTQTPKNDLNNTKLTNIDLSNIKRNQSLKRNKSKNKKEKEKKRVSLKEYVEIFNVECWKQYNKEHNFKTKKTYCKCFIF